MTRRLSCLALVAITFFVATFAAAPVNAEKTYDIKVLLIGNSLSRHIKKPLLAMFEQEGVSAFIKPVAPSIADLQYHVKSKRTEKFINSTDWDVVFLQQKSTGLAEWGGGYQAVRQLYQKINRTGARTLLFQTWRERTVPPSSSLWELLKGDPGENMGYIPIAYELGVGVAPIGWAVRQARMEIGEPPPWDLWKGDNGRHLSNIGDYLAACVVYSVLTGESPRGVWAPEKLPTEAASFLQIVAEKMVITNAATWYLN